MFTEPRVLARDHLEVALLILTECCPRSDRTADLVAAAIRAIDATLAADPAGSQVVQRFRSSPLPDGRADLDA